MPDPAEPTAPYVPPPHDTAADADVGTTNTLPDFGPSAAPNELGRLAGYRVLHLIGRGGMGAVYLGFDDGLNRTVALKVMLPKFAADPRARFQREAQAAAAVSRRRAWPSSARRARTCRRIGCFPTSTRSERSANANHLCERIAVLGTHGGNLGSPSHGFLGPLHCGRTLAL